jgi:hypothetical protein
MPKIDRSRDSRLFKRLVRAGRVLDKAGVAWWVDSGTLLGFVREGNLLPYAHNVNISINAADLSKVLSRKNWFFPGYRLRPVGDISGREWIAGTIAFVQVLPVFKAGRRDPLLILTPKFHAGETMRWVDDRTCKAAPALHFRSIGRITVQERSFPVPASAPGYLAFRYGEWKTPRVEWDTNHDDGAKVGQDELSYVKRRTRWTQPKPVKIKMKLVGRHLLKARRLLADTIGILERNNIRYWLDEGTLLGIARGGEIIPWDHDMDISIHGDDSERFLSLRNQFRPKYRVRPHRDWSGRIPKGGLRVCRIKMPMEKIRYLLGTEEIKLDIFFKYRVDGCYEWIDSFTHKRVDCHYYDALGTLTYAGRTYKIPSDLDAYLEGRYPNWRVPDPNYDSSLDDPAGID